MLTSEERQKFIAYLRQSMESDTAILRQFDTINVLDAMKRMYRSRLAAYKMVIDDLEQIEEVTIK